MNLGAGTHVAKVLHIADKVPLGIDDLIDGLLALLLCIRDASGNFWGHSVDPELASVLEEPVPGVRHRMC
jgi:hypothetical protein